MQVKRVLIVGAGVGGLAAAAALAGRGVDVEVVDLRDNAEVYGVGINQPANSLRALRALGVLDEALAAGFQYDRSLHFDWQGELIIDWPSAFGGDVPANNALSRRDLHRILDGAAQRGGAKIRYGVTVRDVADTGDRVDVTFSDDGQETYDLVIAFDGVRSSMRRLLFGAEHEAVFSGYSVWRLTMPRPTEVSNIMLFQGNGTKAGVIPLSQDSMYLLHVTAEPGNPYVPAGQMADLLKARLDGYGGLIGELRDSIRGCEGIVYSPISEVMLPAPWYRGRAVALGDAAHACAPHLTQGAAMALEDAVVLAEELAVPDRDVEISLAAFMRRRYDRVTLVQDVSHRILVEEMAVTTETLPHAVEHMRQSIPVQMKKVETILNGSF